MNDHLRYTKILPVMLQLRYSIAISRNYAPFPVLLLSLDLCVCVDLRCTSVVHVTSRVFKLKREFEASVRMLKLSWQQCKHWLVTANDVGERYHSLPKLVDRKSWATIKFPVIWKCTETFKIFHEFWRRVAQVIKCSSVGRSEYNSALHKPFRLKRYYRKALCCNWSQCYVLFKFLR